MEDSVSATNKKDSVTAGIKARFEENEKVLLSAWESGVGHGSVVIVFRSINTSIRLVA